MNATECIKTRRSIRKFKPDPVDHVLLESLIETASYSPSWKNSQITRYTAIEDSSILDKIVTDYIPDFNANIIKQAPMLIAVTFVKGRCGYERDGSFSTKKEDRLHVLQARPSALQHMKPVLALLLWASGMRTELLNF